MSSLITQQLLAGALTFDAYMRLTRSIVDSAQPTGMYANPKTHRYTRSNLERMELVLNQMSVHQKLYNSLSDLKEEWIWLVISEPWCGDASWGTPALYLISTASPNIEFKILLRDEHPDIMKEYQTEGSDSIPKLICLHKSDLSEVGNWGPRPQALQNIVMQQRNQPGIDYREGVRQLHAWYQQDMTRSMQLELIDLVKIWKG